MIKKEITFIYMDSAEKSFMSLLAEEAEKRGYKTVLTDNKFARCEIGFYCQHVNFPEYSKFSVIMLHDIIQQYSNWPDLWFREPWDKYDIGILPSRQWVDNWNQCSQWAYSRPRRGVFLVGWPKADKVANVNKKEYRKDFYKKYGLDENKKTVLYAPAWENDNKQDDFVKAAMKLDVNILVKQADVNPADFPDTYEAIRKMYELHKNNKRVTLLPPEMNIFDAIMASDVLVSEESSTMAEAVLLGVPAISVSNWLISDTKPSRFPQCNYSFVEKTNKENLTECIRNLLENYDVYVSAAKEYASNNFSNVGSSCKMIMDIVDDCINGVNIRYNALQPKPEVKVPFRKNCIRLKEQLKRKMYNKWRVRNILFRWAWNVLRGIKHLFKK